MRKVRLLLWRQTKHNKTLTTTLTPYYFLLTPSSCLLLTTSSLLLLAPSSYLLLLVENGAKRFRVSTGGPDAFASRASGLS